MAGSSRFEIDGVLNASGIAKGAQDGKKALSDLEKAVGDVATESGQAGSKVDSFASKLVDASRKAGKSDDDIKDALRGMGLSARQAEDAVERVGDEFKETGRDGERAGDKLEDSLRDVQQQSKRTADEVGDVGERGFRKLGDSANEVSGELKQNLGETFSSFRGDLEDLPQIAQDVFGGMAGSVGTLGGSLALAAGAAGIGAIIAGFQAANEEAEKSAERAADWADSYIEAGGRALSFEQQAAKVRDILTDPERYKEASKNAELWGVSIETAVSAMSGSTSAIDEVQSALDKMRETSEQLAATGSTVTDEWGNISIAGDDLAGMAINGQAALDSLTGEMNRGAESASVMSRWLIDTARATEGATEAVDEFGDSVITLPDGHQVYIDAETGQATTDTDAIEKKIYGIQNKTVNVDADTSEAVRKLDALTARKRTIKVDVVGGAIAAGLKQYLK